MLSISENGVCNRSMSETSMRPMCQWFASGSDHLLFQTPSDVSINQHAPEVLNFHCVLSVKYAFLFLFIYCLGMNEFCSGVSTGVSGSSCHRCGEGYKFCSTRRMRLVPLQFFYFFDQHAGGCTKSILSKLNWQCYICHFDMKAICFV